MRQGKYNQYDYGFRYGVLPDGSRGTVVELFDGSGAVVVPYKVVANAKHPMRAAISKLKAKAVKRGEMFEVTDKKGKRKLVSEYGTKKPWMAALTPAEREAYDEAIQSAGSPAPDVWQYDPDAVGRENAAGAQGAVPSQEGIDAGTESQAVEVGFASTPLEHAATPPPLWYSRLSAVRRYLPPRWGRPLVLRGKRYGQLTKGQICAEENIAYAARAALDATRSGRSADGGIGAAVAHGQDVAVGTGAVAVFGSEAEAVASADAPFLLRVGRVVRRAVLL